LSLVLLAVAVAMTRNLQQVGQLTL